MYPKNSASPPRIAIGAVVQISDGAVQTSGVSVAVRPEGGSETAGGGTVSYGGSSGVVYYVPTQGETNYTAFVVVAYKTGCIPVEKTVVTTAESTAGTVTVGTNNDKTGYSLATAPPTAAVIADAVWAAGTRTLTGFGTLVSDIWASASRTLTAFAGFQINSDVTAIKAKTDNLPASPAATGDIPSADITAIKVKTDQLAFTTANKVDATAEATVDEEVIGDIVDGVVAGVGEAGVNISNEGLTSITAAVSAIRASVSSAPYKGGKLRKVIGDDLVQAAGTQVGWELVNAAGIVDLTAATVKLLITVGGVTTESTSSTVTTPTGATRAGYVQINATDWPSTAVPGDGVYQFEFTVGGDTFTLIEGVAELVAKAGA